MRFWHPEWFCGARGLCARKGLRDSRWALRMLSSHFRGGLKPPLHHSGRFRGFCVSGFWSPASRWIPSGRKPDPALPGTPAALRPPRVTRRERADRHTFRLGAFRHGSQVAGHRSRAAGRCISPLQCAVTQKRACNSFAMRSYKSLDLKSLGMNTYKKHRGGGGLRVVQTLDLIPIFHCQLSTGSFASCSRRRGASCALPLGLRSPQYPQNSI